MRRRRRKSKLALLLIPIILVASVALVYLFMPRLTIASALQNPRVSLKDRLLMLLDGKLILTKSFYSSIATLDQSLATYLQDEDGVVVLDPILCSRLLAMDGFERTDAILIGLTKEDPKGLFDYLLVPNSLEAWKKQAKAADKAYLLYDETSEAIAKELLKLGTDLVPLDRKNSGSLLNQDSLVLCPGLEDLQSMFRSNTNASWIVEEQDLGLTDQSQISSVIAPSYYQSFGHVAFRHNTRALELTLVYENQPRLFSKLLTLIKKAVY